MSQTEDPRQNPSQNAQHTENTKPLRQGNVLDQARLRPPSGSYGYCAKLKRVFGLSRSSFLICWQSTKPKTLLDFPLICAR